jgi:AcrR family transcriptional regulator
MSTSTTTAMSVATTRQNPSIKELAAIAQEGEQTRERADAARNRERILCEAARLFDERGVENVSMEEIAVAAGVGKGTLFRRFGDRAGLASSVLDETERRFQEEFLRGAAPLGPGASPAERIRAFGEALIERLEVHADIALAAEGTTPCARYRSPVYTTYRLHLTALIADADPEADIEYVADTLLAALSAEQFVYLRRIRDMPLERVKAGYAGLVQRLLPRR